MDIKRQFEYEPIFDISASQIGISKWNWVTTTLTNQVEALEFMKERRFDVLPIQNPDGNVTSYFATLNWNEYKHLNINNIDDLEKIYYKLSFKDLIRKFKNSKRHYYFLTDYEDILGLVSFVNLNCQIVYNYLFYIISDLEKSVSEFLKLNIPQQKILDCFSQSNDNHVIDLLSNFNKSIATNSDNDIFQLMYLQTIGITLNICSKYLPDKSKKLVSYSAKFAPNGTYNLIRNKIMHPVKPILSDDKSIGQIDELLNDYVIIKDILNNSNLKQ